MSGRFGVWLMPEAGVAEDLRSLIVTLAREYESVAFEPHVTLLGGIHGEVSLLQEPLTLLAAQLRAVTVRLNGIRFRPEYFRCLYIAIEPHDALDRVREQAQSLFHHTPTGPFEPHVSLLYGDMPEALKGEIAARLVRHVPPALRLDRLALYNLGHAPDAWSETHAVPLH